ncbi:MAG: hypothetical protein RBS73_04010 [Prolixibacteraceae bacterium]|jgi:hypothetical protein|nr:hypothetical protein [Prolixibacteraceae bacterium]
MNKRIITQTILKIIVIVILWLIISEWETVKKAAVDAWTGNYSPPIENTRE